ncbi:MAG: hypothetical protein IJA34_01960 [Lachnospiraceae bacterium]|nr:hypothetical protein [Lachnospiraceae bacterium]
MKNKSDDLIFHTTICAEASQIAYDATKKSPMRISLSLSYAKRFGMENKMTVYLVDFENVRSAGIKGVDKLNPEDKVVIFYSKNADAITFEAHKLLSLSSAEVETFMISKGGRNSLDFQLATYLGYLVMENKYNNIVIISKDKGFLFAIEFWNENQDICNADIFIKTSVDGYLSNEPFVDEAVGEIIEEVSENNSLKNEEIKEVQESIIISKEESKNEDNKKDKKRKKAGSSFLKDKNVFKKKGTHKKKVATSVKINIKNDVEGMVSEKYGNEYVPMLVDVIEKTSNKQDLYKMLVNKLGQEIGRDMYVMIKGEYKNLKKKK